MSQCRLIAVSQPQDMECETPEQLVAYCARVSNPTNQANHGSAPKLLKYLIENEHWSPLEMVSITIEIKTTRDIARQMLRHRSFSFQEFSQRYAEVVDFAEPREARLQDIKNRQNSVEVDDPDLVAWWYKCQEHIKSDSEEAYTTSLKNGIAKEQARAVLPEGLTSSTLYMAGTLRSWVHYCQLRMGNGTQKEHKLIAEECWRILCDQFPAIEAVFYKDAITLLVEDFSKALEKKLRAADDKYEWQDGFLNPHWQESLKTDLRKHVDKGDPLDVAAYCAFAHYHGWSI